MTGELLLPRSLEDATADWFTAAFASRVPGVEVTELRRETVIRGMATKARFELDYNDAGRAAGMPASVWLKSGFEAHSARSAELYAAEVNFFRDIAPLAGVNVPTTYFEAIDPSNGNGVLVMEDLTVRGVTFGHQTRPLSVEVARVLLAEMARYHSFLLRVPEERPWLRIGGAIHSVDVVGEYLDFWPTASTQPRFAFVPPGLDDPVRVRHGLNTMQELDRTEGRWLVHGDPHLGNLFFEPAGTGGFLDWQTVMRGTWAFDVAYFLIVSLTVAERRLHERDLLAGYLHCLGAEGGQPPTWDDAWLAYRRHAMWSFLTVLCPVERQTEDICSAHAERVCAALIDLETFNALGV